MPKPLAGVDNVMNACFILIEKVYSPKKHGSIFDRNDLGMRKHLVDIQYIVVMNPTAGSFEIFECCQRHFATFAVSMPSQGATPC